MKTLRELLTDYCKAEGYRPDEKIVEAELEEVLRETSHEVYVGPSESYRWRDEYDVVAYLMDGDKKRYFRFSSCSATGDNSWEDAGYTFEGIDNVTEVYPKEVKTIEYV